MQRKAKRKNKRKPPPCSLLLFRGGQEGGEGGAGGWELQAVFTLCPRLLAVPLRKVPDVNAILAPPCDALRLRPQDLPLALPVRATPEEALPCLGSVRAPTARGGGPALGPLEVLAPETVTRLN